LLALASVARAQLDYSVQIGRPTFTTPSPVEMGFVNLANGNLHLEIPLGSFRERGRTCHERDIFATENRLAYL
jgi:hypothetical protein